MAVALVIDEPGTAGVPKYKIRLESCAGGIAVVADGVSAIYTLFLLRPDGSFYRMGFIPADTGFSLDSSGRIREATKGY